MSSGVVTPPANGEVEYFTLESTNSKGGNVTRTVEVIWVGYDDVYIQGLSYYLPYAYVKGTFKGDDVIFEKGQYMGSYNGNDVYFGAMVNNTFVDAVATFDEDEHAFIFSECVVDNATAGDLSVLAYWERNLIIAPMGDDIDMPVEIPSDMEIETYAYTAYDYFAEVDVSGNLNIGFYGNDVYIQGMSTDVPSAWIKGTFSNDTTVLFPSGQMLNEELYFISYNGSEHPAENYTLIYEPETCSFYEGPEAPMINLYKDRIYYSVYQFYYKYEINREHILTYMVDNDIYKTITIVGGSTITPEPAPTKEGYTFSGWYGLPETMPAEDVTVTGSFIINQYTIIFNTDGGDPIESITQDYGSTITPPENPTKEGYTFIGWEPDIPETMPGNNLTCVAQWKVNSYTITYIVDGNVYKSDSIAYGSEITPEPAPVKEGYTFSGWTYIPATMPTADVIVMGTFTINSYTLTYIVDGEEYKTSTVVYGSEITPEEEPTKEGYTFSGWSEIPETMPAEDVVVTGSFIVNNYTLTYIVDGEEYKTDSIAYGTAITPEEEPTKEGYTFSGWSEIPETMPAEDVTVTGSFTINQYLLTYVIDGEEYKSYEVDYNTALTPEPAPTKKGMTFSGWGEIPETMPAHDLTLTGTYSWAKEIVDGVIYQVTDTLNNYASVIGIEDASEVTILSDVMIDEYCYTVNNIEDNALPKTATINVSVGRLLLWLWENGYEDIKEAESGRSLSAPEIALVNATASSLTLSYMNEYKELSETVTALGSPIEKGENGYEIVLKGLEPNSLYEELASVTLTFEDASYTKSFSFRTEPLTLTTQQPKVITVGNVVVAATSNLDDEETNVGFEWRRTDWTDEFASNSGAAYLYEGTMEGYIRNLYTEKLWKFRPFYQSNSGNRYYGEWVGIDPTNTSYFEPTVHTYAQITVTGNRAEVKGYAMRGTDNVVSQGFMYWPAGSASSPRGKAKAAPNGAITVLASGNVMTATLEDLEYETTYCYAAFVTTSEGETFFGESQTFSTSYDADGIKDIEHSPLNIEHSKGAVYNLAGQKIVNGKFSNGKLPRGLNIIRYSDGSTKKVLVK
ncbi:MAG: InlB B-repeat-containing protein [Bacteroidaceae bacterium]|nr:InlB B-repeat-containing protein [Bacteroidaceae bacterium]